MIKLSEIIEEGLVRRIGFNPQTEYNLGKSLKRSWDEYHDEEGVGAISSYAEKILNSEAPDKLKKEASKILSSISSKAKNFDDLLYDFSFDDESELAIELNNKISGDTSEDKENTLRFYDFNIDSSLESGMYENVIGLLDQLDQFFDEIIGMLTDETVSKEKRKNVKIGFSVNENLDERINRVIHESDLLEACGVPGIGCRVKKWISNKANSVARSFGLKENI